MAFQLGNVKCLGGLPDQFATGYLPKQHIRGAEMSDETTIDPSVNGLSHTTKAQLRFDMRKAYEVGQTEHPKIVMRRVADQLGLNILGAVPQSFADQWWFWVEWSGVGPEFPPFISKMTWTPVGTV
jgi:hypothetical protein